MKNISDPAEYEEISLTKMQTCHRYFSIYLHYYLFVSPNNKKGLCRLPSIYVLCVCFCNKISLVVNDAVILRQ